MPTPLNSIGEDELLSQITPHLATNDRLIIGAGDDCAVVQRDHEWDELLKTDAIVESVHFTAETTGSLIGRKALARALSDIAAMGGIPEHALISLFVHPSRSAEHIGNIYQGLNQLARAHNVSLAGGESAMLPYNGIILNVALTGRVERGSAILRSTAKEGDLIAVSGYLGGSFISQHHLHFTPRLALARALHQAKIPRAMMDLSDGLGSDLPRMAKASKLGFEIDTKSIPLRHGATSKQAISDGEDYELLFTLAPDMKSNLEKISAQFPESPIHIIGKMTKEQAQILPSGWQHFRD